MKRLVTKLFGESAAEKQLGSGSMTSLVVQFGGLLLNLALAVFLARTLGAEHYGIFTWAFTWTSVLSAIAIFGSDDLLIKIVGADRQGGRSNALVKWVSKRSLAIATSIAVLGVVYVTLVKTPAERNEAQALIFALVSVPVYTMVLLYQSALKGLQEMSKGQYPDKWVRPVVLLLVLAWGGITGANVRLLDLFEWQLMSLVLAMGLAYMHWRQHKPIIPTELVEPKTKANWKSSAMWFFAGTIVGLINVRADILMLGWDWLNDDKAIVGIYNVAARLGDFVAFSLAVTTPVIWPMLSSLLKERKKHKVRKLVVKVARINSLFGLLVGVVLLLGVNFILPIFGHEFIEGQGMLWWIVAGHFITIVTGPASAVLAMGGKEKQAFLTGLAAMLANLVLNLLLIPKFGGEGAAMATGISLIIWNGSQCLVAWKSLGIGTTIFSRTS